MSYNGSGVFLINTPGQPVTPGSTISSTAFNALTTDLANGLTTALTKDGQTTPTSNIPLGGFKITGLGAGVNPTDAINFGQLTAGGFNFTAANLAYTGTFTGGTGIIDIGSGQIYKDATGRIGIKSTPLSGWNVDATVIELASNESFFYNWNNATYISSNLYQDTAGSYRFANSNAGSYYFQAAGQHFWGRTLFTPTPGALAVTVGVASINSSGQFSADSILAAGLRPVADNSTSCGTASFRWTIVYATTGTINTSDARQKTPVRSLKDSEIAAAQELASEIGAFQWLESVEKKGDAARWHIGVTVQRVIEIMEKHSLDPFAYGLVCYDKWDDEFNPEGELVTPAGDVYSLRPDQLSLFIAKGQQVTMQNLASQLEQMKVELAALKG